MVWDEATQQWAPRWGYGRANNPKDADENWIVEAKPNDDGTVDPFEARADAKKEQKQKQKRQEERNRLEAAHAATVGANTGSMQRSQKKSYLKQAIAAAQVSTASVGRFDKALPNEPSKTAGKRKQYDTGVGADAADRDAQRTASVYAKMFPESGAKQAKIVDKTVAAKQAKLSNERANRSAKSAGGGGKGKGGAKGKGGGKGKR